MDKYRIDSHKLSYHVDRLDPWLRGEDIYPIYMEISLSGVCNNRCIFCAFDYLGYKEVFLETKTLKKFIADASKKGVRSILFSGEGEPLLHPDAPAIVNYVKENGIDVAMTTNGSLLSPQVSRTMLKSLSWLRISLNAGTPQSYAQVHGAHAQGFERVLGNIKEAVLLKKKRKLNCVIGVQFLLLRQNFQDAVTLARRLRQIGVNYLIIKPYSQHPLSINRLKSSIDYRKCLDLEKRVSLFSRGDFQVIFRKHTMHKISEKKPYGKCLGCFLGPSDCGRRPLRLCRIHRG